jgi:hypothetical protein
LLAVSIKLRHADSGRTSLGESSRRGPGTLLGAGVDHERRRQVGCPRVLSFEPDASKFRTFASGPCKRTGRDLLTVSDGQCDN